MRIGTLGRSAARILLIGCVLVLLALPIGCSESSPKATISLAVDRDVKQGDMFAVEVRIDTDTACRGAQFELSFDPALMRCDGVVEGGFFKDWANANGAVTLVYPESQTIDNNQGHVSTMGFVVMGAGAAGGVEGSGVLASYHFTALADGTAEPTLSNVVVSDASGNAIPEVEVKN
jgi:hypothetical protein